MSSAKTHPNNHRKLTEEEWLREGKERFGENMMEWRFVCPACGYVASMREWNDVGAPVGAVAFSCIGRWLQDTMKVRSALQGEGPGPCDYTGGGFFKLNPVRVMKKDGEEHGVFEFEKKESAV